MGVAHRTLHGDHNDGGKCDDDDDEDDNAAADDAADDDDDGDAAAAAGLEEPSAQSGRPVPNSQEPPDGALARYRTEWSQMPRQPS